MLTFVIGLVVGYFGCKYQAQILEKGKKLVERVKKPSEKPPVEVNTPVATPPVEVIVVRPEPVDHGFGPRPPKE